MKPRKKLARLALLLVPLDRRSDGLIVARGYGQRWRLMVVDGIYFVTGFAALLLIPGVAGWRDDAAITVLGVMLGMSALGRTRRAVSYWRGWLEGRQAMFASLREASQRQMAFTDWLNGELDRSLAAAGIEVSRPVPDGDGD